MVKVEPLKKEKLKEAIELVERVFSSSPREIESPPDLELSASLNPAGYKQFLDKNLMSDVIYWVTTDKLGRVVGVIGLYCEARDRDEAFWLGWFCVDDSSRRKGIGRQLLQSAIQQTRENGKRFLRLYTSTHSSERNSHRLYEKCGFSLTKEEAMGNDTGEKNYITNWNSKGIQKSIPFVFRFYKNHIFLYN